jgi:hypothetical protein
MYYQKFAQVSVNQSIWSNTSKCNKCNTNLQEFSVFVGEGQRLSTMYSTCCSKCLPIVIKEAIKEGREDAEKAIKNAENRQYEEALKLIRKSKLEKLEDRK